MGIFTPKEGTRSPEEPVQSPASPITFCLDNQPDDDQLYLKGWAFAAGQQVSAELYLSGKLLCSVLCSQSRHDVFSSFSSIPESLLSGFEFVFPQAVLSRIQNGELQLVLRAAQSTEVAWVWNGSMVAANEPQAKAVLADHFSSQSSQVPAVIQRTRALSEAFSSFDLHVVLISHGNVSAIEKNLQTVLTKFAPQAGELAPLSGITLVAEHSADASQLRKLSEKQKSKVSLRVCQAEELSSWQEVVSKKSETLVFYSDESVVLDYLNLEAMLRDFLALPRASVLTPGVFGGGVSTGEALLQGPKGVALSDLQQQTEIHGGDIPALFSLTHLAPVWLSSTAFLCALEQERFGGAKRGLSLPPENQGYSFFCDLRQPVVVSRGASFRYSEFEREQMQALLDTLVSRNNGGNPSGENTVVLLLDKETVEKGPSSSERRQLLQVAERFAGEQKVNVEIVVDAELSSKPYFGRFSVRSLSELLEGKVTATPSSLKLIACSWSCVRTASVVRYVLDCSVFSLVEECNTEAFREHRFEHFDTLHWALQAEMPQFCLNAALPQQAGERYPGLKNIPVFAGAIDESTFRPLPVETNATQVLLAVDESLGSLGQVLALVQGVQKKHSEIEFRLLGGELQGFAALDVAENIRLGYASAGSDEAAMLLNSHPVVLDCTGRGPFSALTSEALACGALPIEIALGAKPSSESDAVHIEDSDSLAGILAEVFSSEKQRLSRLKAKQEKLQSSVKKAAALSVSSLEALETKYEQSQAPERNVRRSASVIIPVYCALDATIQCLRSALRYAPDDFEIIVVNDVSDKGTTAALCEMAESNSRIRLINKEVNGGFVQSCLTGFVAAKPGNDIILLNSDVVLTSQALQSLQTAAYARPRVALASSLSTNSPHLEIELNPGDSLEQAAERIRELKNPEHPTIITPEGQLLYIRRWALDKFGFFDPVYNRGFCEESDLCMRMFLNGADMVVADDSLILHRKSESFGLEGGLHYKRENRPIFDARWARHYWLAYPEFLRRDPLKSIRQRYLASRASIEAPTQSVSVRDLMGEFSRLAHQTRRTDLRADVLDGVEVVFIIPSVILGGGTLSVLQHANELLLRGVETRVISLTQPDPIRFPYLAPPLAMSREQLMELNWSNQKVVATFWLTAYFVKALEQRYPGLEGYYYIQDYEPWFYSRPDCLPTIREAENSYELGLKGVAKTAYLQDTVREQHKLEIARVTPGLARTVFYEGTQESSIGRPTLTAYYRPRTPRRGGKETIEVLREVKRRVPEARLQLFGEDVELSPELDGVVESLGRLSQNDVAKLYRKSDVVMDLSYWHGFGRMGIESMASGAVPILSDSGGIHSYAEHEKNSFIVTLDNLSDAVEKTVRLLKDKQLRLQMRERGLKKVKEFSESRAVDDWLDVMGIDAPKSFEESVYVPGAGEEKNSEKSKVVHL